MRILSMTATFGKLEHETLVLNRDFNIISAGNEWGKSTWCAFMAAMFYGIETRAKSTKTTLADKERYAPWSGSPMAGRMELEWKGRKITIERKTKGRIPMGEFRAYETDSGLPVSELTGANCGQMLLGVERSVFLRAGFIRFAELPVTQDETLRRRLNALVTTGDESGDGERLAKGLKELKNRCRYHRTGLIPQAEAERDALRGQLKELASLAELTDKLTFRLCQTDARIGELENHRDALRYAAAQVDADRVRRAEEDLEAAERRLEAAKNRCENLPSREQAQWAMNKLRDLHRIYLDLQMEGAMLPQPPAPMETREVFRNLSGGEAVAMARKDGAEWQRLAGKQYLLLLIPGLLMLLAAGATAWLELWLICGVMGGAGLALLIAGLILRARRMARRHMLEEKYGSTEPAQWLAWAEEHEAAQAQTEARQKECRTLRESLEQRMQQAKEKLSRCTGGQDPEAGIRNWQNILEAWDEWANAHRDHQKAENYVKTLRAMAKTALRPGRQDTLTYTEEETLRLLSDARAERQQIQNRLSQYQGRLETMESAETVREKLDRVERRLERLEEVYGALVIAQQTLSEAAMDLQRRFAPRITRRAQELMNRLTNGRYTRLTLGEDLTIRAEAGGEDTLWESLWRSYGTVDQLYLALRLAVAEELTPDLPLILDDALVRFDDDRLRAAMEILRQEARHKQVILFTCHSREQNCM